MLPPFDLQGGAKLALVRGAFVTALLSAFGTTAFSALVLPKASAHIPPDALARTKQILFRLALGSVLAGLLGLAVWLVVESGVLADADSAGAAFAAVPKVLTKTTFGTVILLQIAAFLVLAPALRWPRIALGVATVALALQAGHSHAFSMENGLSLLLAVDFLHLLGAGAWLGGLVPLLLVVRMAPPKGGAMAARWFSPLGQWCIAALLVSALWQGWVLVASIPGLIGTAYGWLVLVKTTMFAVLFAFAWINRYHFAPALLGGDPKTATRVLVRSITLQTGAALAIIGAAVVLSGLPPAMHEQAVWPFAQRFSLAAVREDPDFMREVLEAAGALAGGLLLVAVTLILRRWRLPALAAAAAIAWFAIPHFDLLLAQAYPTSYYHSPTGFAAQTITDGAPIFAQNCVACHGAAGHGDGPAAKTLPVPPADLTAAHLWMHSDGELFWWISHGIQTPEGQQAMPGFAGTLDDDDTWAVIDYIRAHNAGTAFRDGGAWPHTIRAPGFRLRCGSGASEDLADLRGRFVRLVFGAVKMNGTAAGVVTLQAATAGDAAAPPGVCVTSDESVAAAYAIVTGRTAKDMVGVQFLIDGDGWLRAMGVPGHCADWNNAQALADEIRVLQAQPVHSANDEGGGMMNMKM